MQRGTPRESDTASRHKEACLLNPCNVVAQYITACYSRHDSDIHIIHRRLELKSDRRENYSHPLCTVHLHPFCVVSHSCTYVAGTLLYSLRVCFFSRSRPFLARSGLIFSLSLSLDLSLSLRETDSLFISFFVSIFLSVLVPERITDSPFFISLSLSLSCLYVSAPRI